MGFITIALLFGPIGHTAKRPCGDDSGCLFERGAYNIPRTSSDPIFAGLPRELRAVESRYGRIEGVPKGWELIATAGKDTLTKTQGLRLKGHPLHAAQLHIENAGAPEISAAIVGSFLRLAREWRRTHPAIRLTDLRPEKRAADRSVEIRRRLREP